MKLQQYNGWYNYETWLVNLWIDNDEYLQEYFREQAEIYNIHQLTEIIKEWVSDNNPISENNDLYSDLLNGAISECNFYEIAENIKECITNLNK